MTRVQGLLTQRRYADGPALSAQFFCPRDVAVDQAGNVYVAELGNNRIRKIDTSGNVTTLAGNGTQGYADGTGSASGTAEFNGPAGVAVDSRGNVYVADLGNQRIRTIDASGSVKTLAGNGDAGYVDGTGGANGTAEFYGPNGIAVDDSGHVYVADVDNNRIRQIDSSGNVTTLAGNGYGSPRSGGFVDGTGGANGTAEFFSPWVIAVDRGGNVYVGDTGNNRLRKIDPCGNVTTLAGNGTAGDVDGTGGATGMAELWGPYGVAVDAAGNVYAENNDGRLRRIVP